MGEKPQDPANTVEIVGRAPGTWRCYNIIDGLPGGVTWLLQDREGYLWMGAEAGLCRYDGSEFATFSASEGAPTNTVRAIHEDRQGRLWFGTWGGVSFYSNGRFSTSAVPSSLQEDIVEAIDEDRDGRIWFGMWTKGILCLDGDRFVTYTTQDGLASNAIRALYCDCQGRVWIGTSGGGVSCYDNGRFTTYSTADGLPDTHVLSITEDNKGRMWFGTWRGGVACLDNGHFTTYSEADGLCANDVVAILEDREGWLWFATWGGGVSCLEKEGGPFVNYSAQTGLLDNRVNAIVEDAEGLLWFAHSQSGITRFDRETIEILTEEPVSYVLIQDRQGRLWFGNECDLCCLDQGQQRRRTFDKRIHGILEDSQGRFWIGTIGDGLHRYDSPEAVWRNQGKRFGPDDGLPSDMIFGLLESRDGTIWATSGLDGYLCRFTDEWFEAVPTPLREISRVCEDSRGRIWLGGWEGGGLAHYEDGKLVAYTEKEGLPGTWIKSLVEDSNGHLWFGTREGLCRFDGRRFISYGSEHGLPRPMHQCAAKDASGQLWFGSHSVGLQRYNGDCFQRLTSEDGLPSNSVTGLVPQTDGSMIIGTYRGIIRYRPRATRPARIEIRAAVADREYPHPTDLELITTQAHLVTISYHGVSLATRQMRYRYILEGYDTQWQDTWQNWVRYSNLPVGDYTFRVIAINRDLVPSTRPASMTLRILPDPKEQLLAEQEAEIGRMTKEIRLHQREERQNKVLVQLARSKTLYGGNLDAAFEEITETAAHTLEVDRVSIWLFNQEGDLLECLKRYERALNAHFDGGAFEAASYPAYMSALEHERILAIDNVNADLRVGPFADSVLFYPGAISVLDAPIRMEGKTTGIVQHVSASKPRTWDRADKDFAASVVGFVALAIEAHELERAEEERRHMESQVQHAQKLESLGVLAGGIAHDFNNLLVAILGNSDLMLKELAQDSPLRQFLEQIQSAALRGSELTNQMLAYSGKGPFALQVVDISRMVEEMSHLLRISISKKVELRCEFASGLSPIEVDPGQLRQVTMNLITNASEAIGDQNGVVRVRTGSIQADRAYLSGTGLGDNLPEGEYVYLEVVDTGCGMSAQTRTRIFDPFFTTKFAGRGLGLAAVLGIIRAHRGTIEIKTKPGAGTTFRVLFPSSSQAPTRPPALPGDRWNAIKGTVLVVDDEEVVRQVARKALERAGLTVLTANDGLEAVERFKNDAERISAVLLDMTMPRMDGKETFQELRRIRPDVPVILSSGYTEQHATERFAEEPRLSFIQKPYLTAVLLDKVSAALNG